MARMQNATWKPLPRPSTARMARYDLVVIHTMVGSLAGTDGYFRRLTNGVNSHFGTGGSGEIWQWVDTAVQSGANGAGNHRTITVENADMGAGFAAWNTKDGNAVPAFTPQQLEANAQICAWAHLQHGVPLVAADSSRPGARGIGYHRLGCDPHRVPDGEKWSSSYGKTCPAPRRIAQIPQVVDRARQIVAELSGAPATRPAPVIAKPVAPPPPSEEFDMLVEIEPGETSKIPVPTGRTYRINVVSDSVFGQQVYGKQVSPGRVVGLFFGHAFGTGEKEWELFVAETHNIEIPCAATSFVEITNKGVPQKPENSRPIAVTLTPVA